MIEEFGLSFKDLAQSYALNTIRIRGNCQGKDVIILNDNESTNGFTIN